MTTLTLFVMALLLVSGSTRAQEAPSCNTVVNDLAPCLPYLKDTQQNPSSVCCTGIKTVTSVPTKTDLVAACECMKNALGAAGRINPAKAASLPKKCGVNVSFPPISKDMDCSKVGA